MRQTDLKITVNTQCAHCGRPMELEIDSEINFRVRDEEKGCSPVAFVPDVNVLTLRDKSIINAF